MKDALQLDGKTFISASRAANLSGYTADYIGQLCRRGKVSARMIGRTWYVDSKNDFLKGKINDLVLPRSDSTEPLYISKVKYAVEAFPTLPQITKPITNLIVYPVEPVLTRKIPISFVVALLLTAASLSACFEFFSPHRAEISMQNIAKFPSMLASIVSQANFLPADAQLALPSADDNQTSGMVTFLNSGSHDTDVAAVQDAFSDQVDVQFDKSGASGIITPVFRDSSTTEGYTFVMVPIKTK